MLKIVNNSKLYLPNVTLAIADCINKQEATDVLEICLSYSDFGDVKFLTDMDVQSPYKVKIPHIGSYSDYSRFMIHDLNDYISTDFVLVVQWDGFILNPEAWSDEFFNYDYIGAQIGWEQIFRDSAPPIPSWNCVGNGGFSLRSKKMLQLCQDFGKLYDDKDMEYSEDLLFCWFFKDYFESQGIKFATPEVAHKFSVEKERHWTSETFGFHNHYLVNIISDGWRWFKNPDWRPNVDYALMTADKSTLLF